MKSLISALILSFVAASQPTHSAVSIPGQAWQYQRQILRAEWTYWGTDRYVSAAAAQFHQESMWRPRAKSWAGAMGLGQFMPATARGESRRCGLGSAKPYSSAWSILARSCHMAYLYKRNYEFKPGCQRYAAALSGYNGGQGNVNKQRRRWAQITGANPNKNVNWFGGVENVRIRSRPAHKENSHYPGRILVELTPKYYYSGYGGQLIC